MLRENKEQIKRKEKSPTGTTPTPLTKQARDLFALNVLGKKETKPLSQSTLIGKLNLGNKPQPPHPDSKKESKAAARTRRHAQEALSHAMDFPPIA